MRAFYAITAARGRVTLREGEPHGICVATITQVGCKRGKRRHLLVAVTLKELGSTSEGYAMNIVLKQFMTLADSVVAIGTPFLVRYRILRVSAEQAGPEADVIRVSCATPYFSSPDIQVELAAGENQKSGTANIVIQGPKGPATVAVTGTLVEQHSFPQDVE